MSHSTAELVMLFVSFNLLMSKFGLDETSSYDILEQNN